VHADESCIPSVVVSEGARSVYVELCGEHDLSTLEAVRVALEPHERNTIVDLTRCAFIDVTVVGVLIRKGAELAKIGHTLEVLVPISNSSITWLGRVPCVRDHLKLTMFDPFEPTRQPRSCRPSVSM
jgi:hypothetical protein